MRSVIFVTVLTVLSNYSRFKFISVQCTRSANCSIVSVVIYRGCACFSRFFETKEIGIRSESGQVTGWNAKERWIYFLNDSHYLFGILCRITINTYTLGFITHHLFLKLDENISVKNWRNTFHLFYQLNAHRVQLQHCF